MDDDRCCCTEAGVRTSEIVRERSYTLCGNIENATRWRHGACLVDAVETLYENFITILHCPALFLDGWKNQWWPVLKFTHFISNCTIFRQEANYRKTKFQPRDQRLNEKLEYKLTCFVHSNIIITEKGHTRGTWSHRVLTDRAEQKHANIVEARDDLCLRNIYAPPPTCPSERWCLYLYIR